MLSLNQLKIFWTVANSPSLTKAAKQLGLSQPSLSQQVAKLEQALGGRLFDRISNQLVLTDAGRYLVRKAETILAEVDEAQAEVGHLLEGKRGRVAVGALSSIARTLVPRALRLAVAEQPDLELDLHELSPVEAVDQLYGRNLQMALLSSYSVAANRISFTKQELMTDPYALAVPRGADLGESRGILNRTIQFNFGGQQNSRIEDWYRQMLPRHRVVAWCRSYETALAMVEAGQGVSLVPLLTAQQDGRLLFAVDLYAVPALERPIVALVPAQYRRAGPCRTLLDKLAQAGRELVLPPLKPTPAFILEAAAAHDVAPLDMTPN